MKREFDCVLCRIKSLVKNDYGILRSKPWSHLKNNNKLLELLIIIITYQIKSCKRKNYRVLHTEVLYIFD